MAKAKATKHTAAELAAKAKAALQNKGGGNAGEWRRFTDKHAALASCTKHGDAALRVFMTLLGAVSCLAALLGLSMLHCALQIAFVPFIADRMGGKVGHAKYKCFVCSVQVRPCP